MTDHFLFVGFDNGLADAGLFGQGLDCPFDYLFLILLSDLFVIAQPAQRPSIYHHNREKEIVENGDNPEIFGHLAIYGAS